MKFDIDSLRALQTLADTGSLQATADHLCISRSAVSWKLKRLQQRTGCNLVRRDGRRLRLTDDGIELLSYGRQIIDAHDAAVRRFLPIETTGLVRVGATEGASSTPLLDTVAPWFRRQDSEIELRVSVEQPLTLDEWLKEGRIDIAITLVLEDDIGTDDIVLGHDELVWAHSGGIDFLDSPPLPLITWGPRCFFGSLASRLLTAANVEHRVNFELPTIAAVRTALASGAGVALLSRGVIAHSDLATTGSPMLPQAPGVAYVLRQRPAMMDNPLQSIVVDQIRTSFSPNPAAALTR